MASYPNLLNGRTTNGNGDTLILNQRQTDTNGYSTVYVFGTFDTGTTVKIQASIDATTWFDIPDASFTAPSMLTITIKSIYTRAVVSSVGASTSLSAHIQ